MQKFNYVFSEIPNDEEGRKFIKQMRKYYNSKSYTMRVKGQYLIDSEKSNWRYYSHGQPMNKSKCIRVYIDDHIKKEIDYN